TVPFAAGLVSLLFLIYGRIGCPISRALVWALVAGFCTLLWPYAGSTFDAVLQAFWLTVAIWSAIEAFEAGSYGWAALSGAAFAMLINVQETYVVLAAAVFAGVPLTYRPVWTRSKSPIVWVMCLGVAVGVATVFAYNIARFGNPLDTGRTAVPH